MKCKPTWVTMKNISKSEVIPRQDCGGRMRIALCMLIVTSMVLAVIVVRLLCRWISIRTTPIPIQTTMCFNQSDLPGYHEKHVEIPFFFSNSTVNNETTFCGVDDKVLTFLAEMALEFYFDCEIHPESQFFHELIPDTCEKTSKTETVVKLVEHRTDRSQRTTLDGQWAIFWKHGSDGGYTKGNIGYQPDDGTVEIRRFGLYFVTSQIIMEMNDTDTHLTHFLYKRYANGTEERLLENRKMLCDPVPTQGSMRLTSSVGAVFVLNDTDRLYVATSNPEHLVFDTSSNNFIVYAV